MIPGRLRRRLFPASGWRGYSVCRIVSKPCTSAEHRPCDSCELVGNGNDHYARMGSRRQCRDPVANWQLVALHTTHNRPSTVNEQAPQIFVSAFADPEEFGFTTGRILLRYKSEPRRELSTLTKCGAIADSSNHCCRAERTNAGDCEQTLTSIVSFGDCFNFVTHLLDTFIDLVPFFDQLLKQVVHPSRHAFLGYNQQRGDLTPQCLPPCSRGNAAFEQECTELVDQTCSPLDQPVTYPMQRLNIQLILSLNRNEPHRWPLNCFRNRFGIGVIVLL